MQSTKEPTCPSCAAKHTTVHTYDTSGKLVGRLLHRACKEYVNLLDYASSAAKQVLETKEQQIEHQRVKYEQLLAKQEEVRLDTSSLLLCRYQ